MNSVPSLQKNNEYLKFTIPIDFSDNLFYFDANDQSKIQSFVFTDYYIDDIVTENKYDEDKKIFNLESDYIYDVSKNVIIGDNDLNIVLNDFFNDNLQLGYEVSENNISGQTSNIEKLNSFVYNSSITDHQVFGFEVSPDFGELWLSLIHI